VPGRLSIGVGEGRPLSELEMERAWQNASSALDPFRTKVRNEKALWNVMHRSSFNYDVVTSYLRHSIMTT
jgi:hypothetical protein